MKEFLKKCGLKVTKHRLTVINVLNDSKIPLTAEDIFKMCDGISLATVYRTLESFVENGILNRITVEKDERHYYEMKSEKHRHYAVCLKCRKMEYVDVCPVHDVKINDFEITGHRLELYGYCKECNK